jgi:wyosine [tRNA(Phe)-imidazoG37] synthetase (radical SAM superfamily)
MRMIHPKKMPHLVCANEAGEIIDLPDFSMTGKSGVHFVSPRLSELIPLPEGSDLFALPGRKPVGLDPSGKKPVAVAEDPRRPGFPVRAVAAFMAPAHTALYSAAFKKTGRHAPTLPLFAYTAVGWLDGNFWVTGFRSDPDPRQDADRFDQRRINARTMARLRKWPHNRLVQHLGRCSLSYRCPAARNYFLGRWEAPVPSSPACNASCVGCISLQTSGCCPSTQDRIAFVPSVDEIVEMAVPHLSRAPRPIISFGQGCEGEPLLQAEVIERAIRKIRQITSRGTINLNTNASLPDHLGRLGRAGLDSIRVSMNSAQEEKYRLYYRPKGFSLNDVKESMKVMKRQKKFISINYFILPGFTDDPGETRAFFDLVEECRPDLIQLRNLNMDPEWYLQTVRHKPAESTAGITSWLNMLRNTFPGLRFGYFNPYLGR